MPHTPMPFTGTGVYCYVMEASQPNEPHCQLNESHAHEPTNARGFEGSYSEEMPLMPRRASEAYFLKRGFIRGMNMMFDHVVEGHGYTNPHCPTSYNPGGLRYNGLLLPYTPHDGDPGRRSYYESFRTREEVPALFDKLLDEQGVGSALHLLPHETGLLIVGLLGIVHPPSGWDGVRPTPSDRQIAESLLERITEAYQYHEERGEISNYG